jgi:hypothetical protein
MFNKQEALEIEINYLEDMLLNEMQCLVREFSRDELRGQLKYIWDHTKTMQSYPDQSVRKIKAAQALLKIKIEKPFKIHNNDKYQKIRTDLWYLYNALVKLY